ncbi:hypothetical protein JD969_05955 [Planctomycetota bacterium]|nr:hypothetical protein JD969_05955 [Planctomycetota bacterium]
MTRAATQSHRSVKRRHSHRSAGFTLIEAALTTVIVGTGVLAIVAAQQAYHQKNDWAAKSGTAMLLANEVRELTLSLPIHDPITGDAILGPESNELLSNGKPNIQRMDDLDDFAGKMIAVNGLGQQGEGVVFSPPINALRQTIPDMGNWSQVVKVVKVREDNIGSSIPLPFTVDSDILRVTVDVLYTDPNTKNQVNVSNLNWIVTRK